MNETLNQMLNQQREYQEFLFQSMQTFVSLTRSMYEATMEKKRKPGDETNDFIHQDKDDHWIFSFSFFFYQNNA